MGRYFGWREKFWGDRYHAVPVSDEEEAQIARLRYGLSQGVKEGFVLDPRDWPGANGAATLVEGSMQLEGLWFDDTKAYAARQRGDKPGRYDFAEPEQVVLTPLPCWRHLAPEEYSRRVVALIDEVQSEALDSHTAEGTAPIGTTVVLEQEPHAPQTELRKSPTPDFHAFRRAVRRRLREAYATFVAAFREAAQRLLRGDPAAVFPEGSFPPAMPFVDSVTV